MQPALQKSLGSLSVWIYFDSHIRIDLPASLWSDNTCCINCRMLFFSSVFVIKISVSLRGSTPSCGLPHFQENEGPPWFLLWNRKGSGKWSWAKGSELSVAHKKPAIISDYQQHLSNFEKQIPTASTAGSASKMLNMISVSPSLTWAHKSRWLIKCPKCYQKEFKKVFRLLFHPEINKN